MKFGEFKKLIKSINMPDDTPIFVDCEQPDNNIEIKIKEHRHHRLNKKTRKIEKLPSDYELWICG